MFERGLRAGGCKGRRQGACGRSDRRTSQGCSAHRRICSSSAGWPGGARGYRPRQSGRCRHVVAGVHVDQAQVHVAPVAGVAHVRQVAAGRAPVAAAAVVTLMTQCNMIKMIMFNIIWQGATGWPPYRGSPPAGRRSRPPATWCCPGLP
jgi:hypothetical protein